MKVHNKPSKLADEIIVMDTTPMETDSGVASKAGDRIHPEN